MGVKGKDGGRAPLGTSTYGRGVLASGRTTQLVQRPPPPASRQPRAVPTTRGPAARCRRSACTAARRCRGSACSGLTCAAGRQPAAPWGKAGRQRRSACSVSGAPAGGKRGSAGRRGTPISLQRIERHKQRPPHPVVVIHLWLLQRQQHLELAGCAPGQGCPQGRGRLAWRAGAVQAAAARVAHGRDAPQDSGTPAEQ